MEARALLVEEERSFSLTFSSNSTSFLKLFVENGQEKLNQAFNQTGLPQANGNGNGKVVNLKVGSEVGVNGKANVLSARDWEEMWEYVVSSRFVRDEIRKRHGYITGISVEDLVRDAYVVGMEELKRCRESSCCEGCQGVGCSVWERKFRVSFSKALRRLQDLGKRNGRVGYLEFVEEEDGEGRLPTTYRRDWDLSANWKLDPLMILCSQEEEEEEKGKEEARLVKVREALKKLKKREREVWELLLRGISPHEVAEALGYQKVQGVYMVIRRTARRLRKFVRSESGL
jgi:DNA-directed RNA polymerase specialized sigma24 family protein